CDSFGLGDRSIREFSPCTSPFVSYLNRRVRTVVQCSELRCSRSCGACGTNGAPGYVVHSVQQRRLRNSGGCITVVPYSVAIQPPLARLKTPIQVSVQSCMKYEGN